MDQNNNHHNSMANSTPETRLSSTVSNKSSNSSYIIPMAIVVAALIIAGAILFKGTTNPVVKNTLRNPNEMDSKNVNIAPITDKDHILGSPKAQIFLVEYSDTECPFCKQFHNTLNKIMNEYGTAGKVAWVYRHFPLYKGDESHPPLHSKAGKEAEAAECAAELGGNDMFWKYLGTIYSNTPSNNGLDATLLPKFAEQIGINRATFTECLSSGKYASKIEKAYSDAIDAGASATPYTVAINSKTGDKVVIDRGAIPYEALKAIVDAMIEKANQ